MKIVFDTETSGLPDSKGFGKFYDYSELEHYNNSRLVELAYIVVDDTNIEVARIERLVIPSGFIVENSHIHGITNAMALECGLPLHDVLKEFEGYTEGATSLIAHNINFDISIILSEAYRCGMSSLIEKIKGMEYIDTMILGHNAILKTIPENTKVYLNFIKYPKLSELYKFIFNRPVCQKHRALADVELCLECYKILVIRY